MKAILSFIRMSVRGINKVKPELGFVLMALNIRKTAVNELYIIKYISKKLIYQIINII